MKKNVDLDIVLNRHIFKEDNEGYAVYDSLLKILGVAGKLNRISIHIDKVDDED